MPESAACQEQLDLALQAVRRVGDGCARAQRGRDQADFHELGFRGAGFAGAAAVDIDILKDGGQTWTGWLCSAQLPAALHPGFGVIRGDDVFQNFIGHVFSPQ